jgi:signal recognition particle subunit SRP54
MLTLIEQAESAFEDEQKERMTAKLVGQQDFTLDDFLEQLLAVQKMGPIRNVLAMMPGAAQLKGQLDEIDDKHIDKIAAIIRSMTPGERENPKLLNGSRRVRIANGSGTTVTDVNQLVERFNEAQKQLKQVSGMFGGAGRRKATKSPKIKRKGKKGKVKERRSRYGGGMPGGLPGGMPPGLPGGMPGLPGAGGQPGADGEEAAELPAGFEMPKIDFSKLGKGKNR